MTGPSRSGGYQVARPLSRLIDPHLGEAMKQRCRTGRSAMGERLSCPYGGSMVSTHDRGIVRAVAMISAASDTDRALAALGQFSPRGGISVLILSAVRILVKPPRTENPADSEVI